MLTDAVLAIVHHLTMFALVTVLVMEMMLLRGDFDPLRIPMIARLDRAFGLLAALMLVVGFARVFYGLKGPEYYFANHFFYAKLGAFLAVGLLSAVPTVKILRWGRALKADATYRPPHADIRISRRFMHLEAVVFILIPVFAALMARYAG